MNRIIILLMLQFILFSCAVFKDDYSKKVNEKAVQALSNLEITYYDITLKNNVEIRKVLVLEDKNDTQQNEKAKKILKLFKNSDLVGDVQLIRPEDRKSKNYLVIENKIHRISEGESFGYAAWGIGSALTLGIVPWWKKEGVELSLTAYQGSKKRDFELRRSYTKYFSLFLLPVVPFKAPYWQVKEFEKEVAVEIIETGFFSKS